MSFSRCAAIPSTEQPAEPEVHIRDERVWKIVAFSATTNDICEIPVYLSTADLSATLETVARAATLRSKSAAAACRDRERGRSCGGVRKRQNRGGNRSSELRRPRDASPGSVAPLLSYHRQTRASSEPATLRATFSPAPTTSTGSPHGDDLMSSSMSHALSSKSSSPEPWTGEGAQESQSYCTSYTGSDKLTTREYDEAEEASLFDGREYEQDGSIDLGDQNWRERHYRLNQILPGEEDQAKCPARHDL